MEFGETEKNRVELQVPWIPITPTKPILPKPVPIYTSEERRQQLGSHFTCFESSTSGAEMNRNLHRLPEPEAAARVHISFDKISSSSNSFSQLLAQADAPAAYSYPRHGFMSNHFVPAFNSQTQFNQAYAFLGHHHHLSHQQQQPFFNVIHDNYQDPQCAGTSYLTCHGRPPSQVGLPPENVITAKDKQVVVTQVNMEEREKEGEEENVSYTMCNYPPNKVQDSVIEFASVSTPCKESYNHNKEICRDIDLNKMPQSKPKRRKHRPKVIKEGKPKKTTKPDTPKPVPSQENLNGKRKQVRRKGSDSTPQTELTGEWTKELMPESAKKACRRSLNFDLGEQPRDGHSACRENETTHFDGEVGIKVGETHVINNYMPLQEDAQASTVIPSKSDSHRARPNAKYAENGGKIWGSMNNWGGNEDSAKVLSKSVVGSNRTQFGSNQHASNRRINLIGAQYNLLQAYSSKYCVQFPNVQKKRRSEKRKFSNTSNTSSMTATKDVQLATFPQEDGRSHSYSSTFEGWISHSAYEKAIHDKFQSLEYHLSSGKRTPTKRRSRVITTRIHDCVSLTSNTANLGSSDRPTFGDVTRPQTCIDALVEEMRGSLTKKKRSKKRSTPTISVSSSNIMQQRHKFVVENHNLPFRNSLDVASEEIQKNMHTVDTLTEQLRHLSIYREARELVLHGQNALVPYNQQNKKYKGLVHEYGTIIPFEGPFDPIKKQRPRPKVHLDEETSKVWKLLMLDINSHGVDGTDEDKAKWWEEERNVFRGRADSFISLFFSSCTSNKYPPICAQREKDENTSLYDLKK